MLRQEHCCHNETIIPLPLSRYISPEEVPHHLLGADCSNISCLGCSQFHYNLPVHTGQVFVGQDYNRYLVSDLYDH